MVLAIDIGNSNLVIGGYEGGNIRFIARAATELKREADQYAIDLAGIFQLYNIQNQRIEGIVLSSVVPALTPVLLGALSHFTAQPPLVLGLSHAGRVKVDIENPKELGMDMLASAIAVCENWPLPAVIIDLGTATKLIALDQNGTLRGVSIAPGLYVSLEALVSNASLLAGIPLEAPAHAIGRNSAESMKSGVVLGSASMLDGLLSRFEGELGPLRSIVATGGASSVVVPHCKADIELCDTLVLDGLYHAYKTQHNPLAFTKE